MRERHDDRPEDESSVGSGARRGQIIILFALFSTILVGMLGLATDLGFAFAQKRTIQNAADAGALAGARHVVRSTGSVRPEVVTFVEAKLENRVGSTVNDMTYCKYLVGAITLADDGTGGDCHAPVLPGAKGVHVKVEEEHDTFFIKVVGGPDTVSTSAEATARVERLSSPPGDGPFLVCATSPWAVLSAAGTTIDSNSPSIIIKVGGAWQINPLASGVTYKIFDNQISNGPAGGLSVFKRAGCKATAADFNGAAESVANKDRAAPGWFEHKEGSAQGTIVYEVEGVGGCKPAQLTNCVMLLPLAVDDPAQDSTHAKQIYVVGYAAFYVTQTGSGAALTYYGKLLNNYIVQGPSTDDWTKESGGIAVIRLVK